MNVDPIEDESNANPLPVKGVSPTDDGKCDQAEIGGHAPAELSPSSLPETVPPISQSGPGESQRAVLSPSVPPALDQRSSDVRSILNDPVTKHMKTAAPLLRASQTVHESLELVRSNQNVGRIVYFYVVDEEQRLQGVVATRKLLLSTPQARIRDLMSSRAIAISSTATVLEACEFFTLHKLLAFPVVDADRKVVGAVDVDLYTDEIQEIDRRQDSDDLFQLIGVHLSEAARGDARLAFRGRFPWLLCNVGGGMLSALIADAFQDVSTLAVVAPFIALVTALAESVSIQSVSLAIQELHSRQPNWQRFARIIRLELFVGLLLGGACGLTVAMIAWLWKGNFIVSASLFLGIVGGVVASAGVGLSIPYLLKLFRRDPQLASGPIALALSDVVTLLCYFNLGRWLLN